MGGIVSSIFGGGGSSSAPSYSAPSGYMPQGSAGADTAWQAALASLQGSNPYTSLLPTYNSAASSNINNPYAGGAQTAANTAGGTAGDVGSALAALSKMFSGEASSLAPSVSSVLNMGMDPQQELYNQTLQKVNDQSNVANAQYGLTGQQAAGNLQQADTNFNIDWQSQQLGRALQGISGASTLAGTQQNLGNAAGTAGTGATTLQGQAGSLPYSAFGANIGNILQTLTGQGSFGAQNTSQIMDVMQQIIPYLNQGTGATNAAANAASVNAQNTSLAGQGLGSLFSGLGGLGSLFSGGGAGANLSNFGVLPGAQSFGASAALDNLGPIADIGSTLSAGSSFGAADLASIAAMFAL